MTSYTKRVKEFRDALIQESVEPQRIDKILALADRHQVLAEIACSVNVGDKFEQEDRELSAALKACIGGGIRGIRLDGDPRGFTVKLFLASGKWNSWGGAEAGYGVPTRERSMPEVERIAAMPAKHWRTP